MKSESLFYFIGRKILIIKIRNILMKVSNIVTVVEMLKFKAKSYAKNEDRKP